MVATRITIVIPTCNRPEALAICLDALQPQLAQSHEIEVLVLDDGIEAATREMMNTRFTWAQWHEGPRRGPAANRNRGVSCAKGAWILFLDDDCIPRPGYLRAYEAVMQESQADRVLLGATFSPQHRASLLWEAPHNPEGKVLISCNFAIPRALFHDLGGFDERFPMAAFEDTELEGRIRKRDIPVRFVPEATVDHPLRRIPGARKLAGRWEARVISAMDLGASSCDVAWRLPEHVFKVIVSRFRGAPWNADTLRAAARFAMEFVWLLVLLPTWIKHRATEKRSSFWAAEVARGQAPARFGL